MKNYDIYNNMLCYCGCGIVFILSLVSSIIFSNTVHYLIFFYHIFIVLLNTFYLKKYSYNIHIITAMFLNLLVLITKIYKNNLPLYFVKIFPILWSIISFTNTIIFIGRIIYSFYKKKHSCNFCK